MLKPKLAKQIMVTKIVTLPPDMHVYDGIAWLLKHNFTGAPVVDSNQNYLGVFSEKCCMSVLQAMARSAQSDKNESVEPPLKAQEFMVSKLTTLAPDADVFDAIDLLLKKRISGAPVLGADGKFLGVFSEKNSMQVLISAAYDQLPTTRVDAFMNRNLGRVISPDTDLFQVAEIFLETPFRRLEVVDEGRLLGQISRRDVLRAKNALSKNVRHRLKSLVAEIASEHGEIGVDQSDSTMSPSVSYFMDQNALTTTEDVDLLAVARIFLDTPYRRLPVLRDGHVVGQISRRDVLVATHEMMAVDPPQREKTLLYLSSLVDRQDAPFG